MAALRDKLVAAGVAPDAIARVKAPAGLDLGAITPEEIAMSILAEITVERRRGQRIASP
jgi:xanthine dehydrogenase accessory factor